MFIYFCIALIFVVATALVRKLWQGDKFDKLEFTLYLLTSAAFLLITGVVEEIKERQEKQEYISTGITKEEPLSEFQKLILEMTDPK